MARGWTRRFTRTASPGAAQDGNDPEGNLAASDEAAEEVSPAIAMIHGANYGLLLGLLSCILFMVLAPLMLILSAAGAFYSSRALWQGLYRYRILVYKALVGLLLSISSVGLHYLNLTQQLPVLLDMFGGF